MKQTSLVFAFLAISTIAQGQSVIGGGIGYWRNVTAPVFGSVTVGDGTCGSPSLHGSDADSGENFTATPTVATCINGVAILTRSSSAVTSTVPIAGPAGTAGAPGVTVGGTTEGMYQPSAGNLSFSAAAAVSLVGGGVTSLVVNSAGLIVRDSLPLQWGSSTFSSPDVSLSRGAADELLLAAGDRMRFGGVVFASLGTPTNGSLIWCSDCTIAATCAGAGTGAFAKRLNGVWVCN